MSALNLSPALTRYLPAPDPPRERRAGMFARGFGALRRGASRIGSAALRATSGGSFTDRILRASHRSATGELSGETETAARDLAGRKIGRIFQTANLKTPAPALATILTPQILAYTARRVAMDGGAVLLMYWRGPNDGVLLPCEHWEVEFGGADPNTWQYQLTIPAPSGTRTGYYGRADVFHVAQDLDPIEPWYGTSAGGSVASAELPARARRGLASEHKMPVNRIVPLPPGTGRGDSEKDKIRERMKQGLVDGGFVGFPETAAAGYAGDGMQRPQRDWTPTRMGPEPTAPQVDSYFRSEGWLLAAHGIHPGLTDARAPAAAIREARRQVQEECEAIARLIEAEAMRMFGVPCRLWWRSQDDVELIHARTAEVLTKMGVDPEQALAAAGFGEDFDVEPPQPAPEPPKTPPKGEGPPNA